MQIQETTAEEEQLISYKFTAAPNPVLEDKAFKELLTKWGLVSGLKTLSFRFNQKFDELSINDFLKDLFNDPEFRNSDSGFMFSQPAEKIEFNKLTCTQTKLDMLQDLESHGIVAGDSIKMCLPEYHEDIEISTYLRQAILMEESEYWEAFSESSRKEFLFHIFSILVFGGSMCQYEDNLSVYQEWTKFFYKNLISARKDTNTDSIFVESQVFEITSVDGAFDNSKHFQNRCYVIVNPSLRNINIVTNQWTKFW